MGIQAIKGVEIGDGFRTATRRGSIAHDEIERGSSGAIQRRTDRAGGTEGGMSNGEILRVSIAMKPLSDASSLDPRQGRVTQPPPLQLTAFEFKISPR